MQAPASQRPPKPKARKVSLLSFADDLEETAEPILSLAAATDARFGGTLPTPPAASSSRARKQPRTSHTPSSRVPDAATASTAANDGPITPLNQGTAARGPKLAWAVVECQGKRPYMEDRYDVLGDLGQLHGGLEGATYLSVLDGHGGINCCDFTKAELPRRVAAALAAELEQQRQRCPPLSTMTSGSGTGAGWAAQAASDPRARALPDSAAEVGAAELPRHDGSSSNGSTEGEDEATETEPESGDDEWAAWRQRVAAAHERRQAAPEANVVEAAAAADCEGSGGGASPPRLRGDPDPTGRPPDTDADNVARDGCDAEPLAWLDVALDARSSANGLLRPPQHCPPAPLIGLATAREPEACNSEGVEVKLSGAAHALEDAAASVPSSTDGGPEMADAHAGRVSPDLAAGAGSGVCPPTVAISAADSTGVRAMMLAAPTPDAPEAAAEGMAMASQLLPTGHGGSVPVEPEGSAPPKPEDSVPPPSLGALSASAMTQAFTTAFRQVDDDFLAMAGRKAHTDGTTVLSALLRGCILDVANCGDTRAVLGRKPPPHPRFGAAASRSMRERESLEAHRLSVDHKPDLPDETERVRAAGGQVRSINGCWRVTGPPGTSTLLAISRAFGDRELKQCTAIPLVSHVPAVVTQPLCPRDRLLILASDGLWDVVDDAQAVQIACAAARGRGVVHPPPPGPDLDGHGSALAAARALVSKATESGSMDNITVLVAWLLWPEEPAAAAGGASPASASSCASCSSTSTAWDAA